MRDNFFLNLRLKQVIREHFPEIGCDSIDIKFGCKAKTRLGSIRKLRHSNRSLIIINGLFCNTEVPETIIDATIAHELCHFVHGFSSPLPQLLAFPHRGGVVNVEMERRSLSYLVKFQKKWLKENWPKIVTDNFNHKTGRRIKKILFYLY